MDPSSPRLLVVSAGNQNRLRKGKPAMSPRANHRPAMSEPRAPLAPGQGSHALFRLALNAWIVFHVAAVIIAPAAVSPASGLVEAGWSLFQPYLQILDLNHGYHFFAPEPEDSTLLAFEAERTDGTVVKGRIPDREIAPRLLYHRHFMLTEQMKDAPAALEKEWVGSYAEHLCRKYGAARVKLTGQIHHLPTMEMVRQGVRLDDPSSFDDEPLGTFECKNALKALARISRPSHGRSPPTGTRSGTRPPTPRCLASYASVRD